MANAAQHCGAIPSACMNILEHKGPISLIHFYSTPNHDALAFQHICLYDTCVSVAFTACHLRWRHCTDSHQRDLSTSIFDAPNVSSLWPAVGWWRQALEQDDSNKSCLWSVEVILCHRWWVVVQCQWSRVLSFWLVLDDHRHFEGRCSGPAWSIVTRDHLR